MGERKSARRRHRSIERLFDELPKAKESYEGFCPIMPRRLTFETDLGAIVEATRHRGASSRKEIKGIWDMSVEEVIAETKRDYDLLFIPRSRRYYDCVEQLREFFIRFAGGDIQPMTGNVALEIEVVYPTNDDYERRNVPERYRPKVDVDNCFKPIQDALDFRAKTKDGKPVGIIVNDTSITSIRGGKHERRSGEETGFYFSIRSVGDEESTQACVNGVISHRNTSEEQRQYAMRNAEKHCDRWEERLSEGLDASAKTFLRLACLATDSTPLDPLIAQHYLALRQEFNREVASKFALDEQSEVSYRKAKSDVDLYENLLCEIEEEAGELAGKHEIDLSVVSKPMSIRELNLL